MLLHHYKLKLQGFYNYIIFSDIFCLKNVYNWKMISKFAENSVHVHIMAHAFSC